MPPSECPKPGRRATHLGSAGDRALAHKPTARHRFTRGGLLSPAEGGFDVTGRAEPSVRLGRPSAGVGSKPNICYGPRPLRAQAVRKLGERFRIAAQSYGCCDFFSRCEATGLENQGRAGPSHSFRTDSADSTRVASASTGIGSRALVPIASAKQASTCRADIDRSGCPRLPDSLGRRRARVTFESVKAIASWLSDAGIALLNQ
jgi:hypothetical protein